MRQILRSLALSPQHSEILMPTNYSGRIATIVVVLPRLARGAIFPQPRKFSAQTAFEPDLKPGIDMVGGTSLLYEIKPPEGGRPQRRTSPTQVDGGAEEARRPGRRAQPDLASAGRHAAGNPDAADRNASEARRAAREAFAEAQASSKRPTSARAKCIRAVEKLDRRRPRAKRFEPARHGQRRAREAVRRARVHVRPDPAGATKTERRRRRPPQELEYDKLKAQIDSTNLPPHDC